MHKRGFTLIELLAVVLIMGILTSIAVPQYRRSLERSRIAESYQVLTAIYDSRERWRSEKMLTGEENPTFSLLDISLKGQAVSDSEWKTDSFTYHLDTNSHGSGVWAKIGRGRYAGIEIFFDGSDFSCCDLDTNPAPSTAGDYCEFFNIMVSGHCNAGGGGLQD